MKIPLIGPSSESRSLTADAQKTVNLYGETIESGTGKNKRVLYGKPGLSQVAALERVASGMESLNNRLWVVSNNKLVEFNGSFGIVGATTGTFDLPGVTSYIIVNGPANDLDYLIVANQFCYYFHDGGGAAVTPLAVDDIIDTVDTDGSTGVYGSGVFDQASLPSGTLVDINFFTYTVDYVANRYTLYVTTPIGAMTAAPFSATNLPLKASSACLLDGYAIVSRPGTRQINISKFGDFSSWDPADFALKEGSSENLCRVLANSPQLLLIGTEQIEFWSNTGNPDFPFEREPGGTVHLGSSEPDSWVTILGTPYGLCSDSHGGPVAYRFAGYAPQRVSTHAQEDAWRNDSDAKAFAYQINGHWFWQLNFNTNTWTYDVTEQEWTERGLLNTVSGDTFYRDLPQYHTCPQGTAFQGRHIVSSYLDANLYEMSLDYTDDAGTPIRWVRRLPHLFSEKKRLFWHRLIVETETGTVAPGDPEPLMELRVSRDGGKNYGPTHTKSMGTTGQTKKRVIWRQLGAGRDIVPEIAGTSKAKVAIVDAYGEITEGTI